MPRFVILAHDHPVPHWDLFLEAGPVLRSWRLAEPLGAGAPVAAEPTPDHRLDYLDYEGPVSGGRGTVSRVESGNFEWVTDNAEELVIHVVGRSLVGRLTINLQGATWICTFHPD